jgi:acetolactate synthase-1/2/3 large subunit
VAAARDLARWAARREWPDDGWRRRVEEAVQYRPEAWKKQESPEDGPLHAIDVCRAVQELLDEDEEAVLISDGGEFGQWAQACISAPHRVINGTGGSIGSAVPFALAARLAFPASRIVTILGDGTFGFHPAEFDTAVRNDLPFVAVVGNDAAWNAEYQIQLREFGEDRVHETDLLPARYDRVVESLGGHGEHVTSAKELRPAIERAIASGLPACVNVDLARVPAPRVRRS